MNIPRILIVYYSQTGAVMEMCRRLIQPLENAGAEVHWAEIQPMPPYPFPWKNLHTFFNVMPETVLSRTPEIRFPEIDRHQNFDLILIAYSVWFLSPSLPIQAFFHSKYADVLAGAKVVTLSVSRKMWLEASEKMKRLLREAGAIHLDNIAVTHRGGDLTTLITMPRFLVTGNRKRFIGLDETGIDPSEAERMERLGSEIVRHADRIEHLQGPMLAGQQAAPVQRKNVVVERVGNAGFNFWAHFIRMFGNPDHPLRHIGVMIFIISFVLGLLLMLPLLLLITWLSQSIFRTRFERYVARMELPSGP